jgi:3-deoxy-D-manno-octulosonate 8-phosphate phosphatase KdsC-like HAD superfamily phosphatase
MKPPDDLWRGRIPPILALSQVATLGDKGMDIDASEIVVAIQDAEAKAASEMTFVTEEKLKLMIRQQVKAEEKTALTDDVFVAAYRQHGSIRQAAAFLSPQTGQDISKDQVHRVLQRAGGATAVLNTQDSDWIQRPSRRSAATSSEKDYPNPNPFPDHDLRRRRRPHRPCATWRNCDRRPSGRRP